jgi:PPOX class probable F420-dependent enzyme
MAIDPADPGPDVLAFLAERHLATLTTLRPDGSPHVVPVGFTYDPATCTARVITSGTSAKARHLRDGQGLDGAARVAVCQLEGRRWLTLEGTAQVRDDAASVAEAVERYARRYRQPRENPARVAIEISVDRILGSA